MPVKSHGEGWFQTDAWGTEQHNLQMHFNPLLREALLVESRGADLWLHVLQRRGTEVQSQVGDLLGGPEPWSSVLHA